MIMSFRNKKPKLHTTVFVAPGAHVIGDVTMGKNSSVWFGAVLRGDIHSIRVGENTKSKVLMHWEFFLKAMNSL